MGWALRGNVLSEKVHLRLYYFGYNLPQPFICYLLWIDLVLINANAPTEFLWYIVDYWVMQAKECWFVHEKIPFLSRGFRLAIHWLVNSPLTKRLPCIFLNICLKKLTRQLKGQYLPGYRLCVLAHWFVRGQNIFLTYK